MRVLFLVAILFVHCRQLIVLVVVHWFLAHKSSYQCRRNQSSSLLHAKRFLTFPPPPPHFFWSRLFLFFMFTCSSLFLHVGLNILCRAKLYSSVHLVAANFHPKCDSCRSNSYTPPCCSGKTSEYAHW